MMEDMKLASERIVHRSAGVYVHTATSDVLDRDAKSPAQAHPEDQGRDIVISYHSLTSSNFAVHNTIPSPRPLCYLCNPRF